MEKRPCSSRFAKLERNLHHRSLGVNGFELIDFAIPADNGKTSSLCNRVGTRFVAAIQQRQSLMQQHCWIQIVSCQSVHFIALFYLRTNWSLFIITQCTLKGKQHETYLHQAVTKSDSAIAQVIKKHRKTEFRVTVWHNTFFFSNNKIPDTSSEL